MTASWQKYRSAGEQALNEGRLEDAEHHWLLALAESEYYPYDDPRRATTLEGLAEAYFRQSKHDDAENCCRQVLSIYETALGPEHPDVGVTANNLAMLLHSQKKYADAEPLYKRALSIRKKALGDNHPDVIRLLESYADLLMKTHREEEAQTVKHMIKGITTGKWNRSGNYQAMPASQTAVVNAAMGVAPQPSPMPGMSNKDPGSITGPLPAFQNVQEVTGPHPSHRGNVQISRGTGHKMPAMTPAAAAAMKVETHSPAQAVAAPQMVPTGNGAPTAVAATPADSSQGAALNLGAPQSMAALGPAVAAASAPSAVLNSTGAHAALPPQTGSSGSHQALRQAPPQAKPAPANDGPLWMRQWNAYKDFAEEATRRNLLELASKQWQAALQEAESSGEANPRLAYTLDNLADNLCRLGKFDEAETVLNRCIRMKTDAIGENHVTVALSISNLARLHYAQKSYGQAETYLYDVIRIYENVFGEEHPETASALYNLALIYHQQKQFDQAEPVYKRCWNVRKRVLGEDHADTVKVRDNYSKVLAIKQQRAVEEQKQKAATTAKPYVFSSPAEQQITGSWRVLELPQDMQLGSKDDQ